MGVKPMHKFLPLALQQQKSNIPNLNQLLQLMILYLILLLQKKCIITNLIITIKTKLTKFFRIDVIIQNYNYDSICIVNILQKKTNMNVRKVMEGFVGSFMEFYKNIPTGLLILRINTQEGKTGIYIIKKTSKINNLSKFK